MGFKAASAKEWNLLPLEIKLSPSVASFKTNLKTFIFKQQFEIV
jgi:hypothetical protein